MLASIIDNNLCMSMITSTYTPSIICLWHAGSLFSNMWIDVISSTIKEIKYILLIVFKYNLCCHISYYCFHLASTSNSYDLIIENDQLDVAYEQLKSLFIEVSDSRFQYLLFRCRHMRNWCENNTSCYFGKFILFYFIFNMLFYFIFNMLFYFIFNTVCYFTSSSVFYFIS